jgi:hypothetical protein
VLRNKTTVWAVALAVAGVIVAVAVWPAAAHLLARTARPGRASQADALGLPAAGAHRSEARYPGAGPLGAYASQQPQIVGVAVASRSGQHRKPAQAEPSVASALPGYLNPLRAVRNLVPERVDEGVDFSGTGPVYALGDAVITNAKFGYDTGWPGGGWITYRLTAGPGAGLMVYVAEDITPAVTAGEHVSSSTVVGNMFEGGDGIETGWAEPSGLTAESQLPAAGSIGGYGPFPTTVGLNFEELLLALGVPAAPNRTQPASGFLPPNYPPTW